MPATATPPRRRAPRFARTDAAQTLELTERDLAMLEALFHRRFATARQLARLVDGSDKKIAERLGALFRAGYVDRPPAQALYYIAGGGSQPIVVAIANDGVRALSAANRLDARLADRNRLYWSQHNASATKLFIRHTLATTDIAVALVAHARAKPRFVVHLTEHVVPTFKPDIRDAAKPTKWHVPVRFDDSTVTVGNEPDLVASLRFDDAKRANFLIEADTGSMPISRAALTASSLMRKFLAVHAAHAQGLHTKTFGWTSFRHLTITATRQRADNILAFLASHPQLKTSKLFLVTDHATLLATPDIYLLPWRHCDGSAHRLLDDRYLAFNAK